MEHVFSDFHYILPQKTWTFFEVHFSWFWCPFEGLCLSTVGQNQARTFLPLVCESRIYKYLQKTFTAYVHDLTFTFWDSKITTLQNIVKPSFRNAFWIMNGHLDATAKFLGPFRFSKLNFFLCLSVGSFNLVCPFPRLYFTSSPYSLQHRWWL